eukprot:1117286-Alexandrium_andersonii.AAC.1
MAGVVNSGSAATAYRSHFSSWSLRARRAASNCSRFLWSGRTLASPGLRNWGSLSPSLRLSQSAGGSR